MPDHVLTEEPLQFGEGGRLFGILTLPSMPPRNPHELPVFVILSAGLLHRVGPYRLHVRLARELAQMGFTSLRVDLAGTGDSPPRPGLTNQQSVAADFAEILGILDSRLGRLPLVLAGLCSGADNAMTLALSEPRVVGMVLLDPICFPDRGLLGRGESLRSTRILLDIFALVEASIQGSDAPAREKAGRRHVCRSADNQGLSDSGASASGV